MTGSQTDRQTVNSFYLFRRALLYMFFSWRRKLFLPTLGHWPQRSLLFFFSVLLLLFSIHLFPPPPLPLTRQNTHTHTHILTGLSNKFNCVQSGRASRQFRHKESERKRTVQPSFSKLDSTLRKGSSLFFPFSLFGISQALTIAFPSTCYRWFPFMHTHRQVSSQAE